MLRRACRPREGFQEGQGESQAQWPHRPQGPRSSVPLCVLFPQVHTSCPTNSFYSNSPFKTQLQAFTGGSVGKNHPDNPGDTGRSPVQEDSTCCGATKPRHLEPVLHSKRNHFNEKPAYHNKEELPLATTRESPRAAVNTQCSQELINFRK